MSQGNELDIVEHILDSPVLEFFHWKLPLPTLHVFGYDLPVTKNAVMMWIVSLVLIAILIPIAKKDKKRGLGRTVAETFLLFIRDELAMPQIGEKGIVFVPFLSTLFCFILFCNLLGLFPFASCATANINVTASLGLISFCFIHYSGMREHGYLGYFKALVPPVPGWLWPLMFVIEVVGHISKPVSLAIRLFANLTSGHIVLLAFLSVIFITRSYAFAFSCVLGGVAICTLEILVAFLQAFVFTYLTTVFLGTVVAEEH